MTKNAFLTVLRQYAALSRRYQVRFTEAVNALTLSHKNAIDALDIDLDAKLERMSQVDDIVDREYFSVVPFADVSEVKKLSR